MKIGLDLGSYAVKGILIDDSKFKKETVLTEGDPIRAAEKCIELLFQNENIDTFKLGLTGTNAEIITEQTGVDHVLEIEALQKGLSYKKINNCSVLSLGHENMYYLEIDSNGIINYFNRNGQCAAGSGAFWYQQATRMGYNDEKLADIALKADNYIKISGRCAVFAKSDMTHAINEGATQSAVSAGMAKALADLILTNVAQNRINNSTPTVAVGGVANNKAVMKYIDDHLNNQSNKLIIPEGHEYLGALGAAIQATDTLKTADLQFENNVEFIPENPIPPLNSEKVNYMKKLTSNKDLDLSIIYLGVDCGSVSTKCSIIDRNGNFIGGIYLPTAGRPALQVLELMKNVDEKYGNLINNSTIIACTTGSGRFLSQKILNAEYAVDEITCQAEGVKFLCEDNENTISIIEIGGEDSKFLQLKDGLLFDYNMNPVCAAGTGTFLENLANLLGVKIEEEFSNKAFEADFAIDLGDTCTLLSQSALVSAASRGLPLSSQLASLAYSSARNYISKTVENRPLEGKIIFTGATAYNHALASAFAEELDNNIIIPPYPELSGAIGSAIIAKVFYESGKKSKFSFKKIDNLYDFKVSKSECNAACDHEHNCTLDVIKFTDGSKFLYGDRCGRFSNIDKETEDIDFPDLAKRRNELFFKAAGNSLDEGPTVGIAKAGMFYDLFPFWSAFFKEIGAKVVLSSDSSEKILEKGKKYLNSEMCYPVEVLFGHYKDLLEMNVDYIFIPEVIDMEPLPWGENWPKAFTCTLMQTIKGIILNSFDIQDQKILYAQLNYKGGKERIKEQLKNAAEIILKDKFNSKILDNAVEAGYKAQKEFHELMIEESKKVMEELKPFKNDIAAVFLGRPYTLYDDYVSKKSLHYSLKSGLAAVPHEYFTYYFWGWFEGKIENPIFKNHEEDLVNYFKIIEEIENIYPIQVQKMITTVVLVNFLNRIREHKELPRINFILQDPFKCGPNAMLRHYLGNLTNYLRLTLDEHTAPAGMITRLEAFKNTYRTKDNTSSPVFHSSRTKSVLDNSWKKILIPEPTHHAKIFAAMFRNYGIDAETLPQSRDKDFLLARRYINGEECLPFIQNVQDFLEYLFNNGNEIDLDKTVFFQGWACGPCRYGFYAPTQSIVLGKAGFGEEKICSVSLGNVFQKFGFNFIVGAFVGSLTMDMLYKILHSIRPYEKENGLSDKIFEKYSNKLIDILHNYRYSIPQILTGKNLEPIKRLLHEASEEFSKVPVYKEKKPLILLAGEFYVRLDPRSNQYLIRKIEKEGGEVSLSPATEIFSYTALINYHEAKAALKHNKNLKNILNTITHSFINWLGHKNENEIQKIIGKYLRNSKEPSPEEIREHSKPYVSEHYGGEPPMTIGRVSAYTKSNSASGAILVAPFTCMPGSVVEAQVNALREEINIPIVAVYYDGKDNVNREEFIESLIFQAKQKMLKDENI